MSERPEMGEEIMKPVLILGVFLVLALLVAGCTSTTHCIPVRPMAVTRDQGGNCLVVIENVSYTTVEHGLFGNVDCSRIKPGEVNWVKFDTLVLGAPISSICEGSP